MKFTILMLVASTWAGAAQRGFMTVDPTVEAKDGVTFTVGETQVPVSGSSAVRRLAVVCNTDPILDAWVGEAGVQPVVGVCSSQPYCFPAMTCRYLNYPKSFQGQLYAISDGTMSPNSISFVDVNF